MFKVLDATMPHLPQAKPRYLMGVGKPDDIIGAVMRGVDMFDCVIPTRSGRFARAYTTSGERNIRNAKYTEDAAPLQETAMPGCQHYSRAYLHHLFKAEEMLGAMLLTWHNLTLLPAAYAGIARRHSWRGFGRVFPTHFWPSTAMARMMRKHS